jgi:hypothetical protein
MFGASATVDLPFNPDLAIVNIRHYDSALEKGFIAEKLRSFFPGKAIDLIKWKDIRSDRATGVYIGPGKGGLRGMILTLSVCRNRQALDISVQAPSYVPWMFVILCLIGFAMPPLWLLLALGWWSINVQSKRFVKVLAAELIAMPPGD